MKTTVPTDQVRSQAPDQVPSPGTYAIDASRSRIEFVARHLVVTKVRGRFHDVKGTVVIDEAIERSRAQAEIRAASVDTGIAARDRHLRSADFFDVEKHPVITFRSTGLEPGDSGAWRLHGEVTLLGQSHQVELDVYLERVEHTTGAETMTVRAVTQVDRNSWGLTWSPAAEAGGVLVAHLVDLDLRITVVAVP